MYQGSSLYVFTMPVVAYIIWRGARERQSFVHVLMRMAFAVYVTELTSRTFFPLPVDAAYISLERASSNWGHNLIPLRTISTMLAHPVPGVGAMQIVGNLALFLPLGYFLPLVFRRLADFRYNVIALLVSVLSVEVCQFLLSVLVYRYTYRSFDVDDVLLNLTGALAGYGLYRLVLPGIPSGLPDQRVAGSGSRQ